jgi:hypothetical protein
VEHFFRVREAEAKNAAEPPPTKKSKLEDGSGENRENPLNK